MSVCRASGGGSWGQRSIVSGPQPHERHAVVEVYGFFSDDVYSSQDTNHMNCMLLWKCMVCPVVMCVFDVQTPMGCP